MASDLGQFCTLWSEKKTHLYSQNLQRTTERKKSQLFTCTKFIGIRWFTVKLSITYSQVNFLRTVKRSYCIFSTCVSSIPEFKKFFKDEIAKFFFVYLISFHTFNLPWILIYHQCTVYEIVWIFHSVPSGAKHSSPTYRMVPTPHPGKNAIKLDRLAANHKWTCLNSHC